MTEVASLPYVMHRTSPAYVAYTDSGVEPVNVNDRYAANGARGGVLEANGAASIKFRDRDLLKTGTFQTLHTVVECSACIRATKKRIHVPVGFSVMFLVAADREGTI